MPPTSVKNRRFRTDGRIVYWPTTSFQISTNVRIHQPITAIVTLHVPIRRDRSLALVNMGSLETEPYAQVLLLLLLLLTFFFFYLILAVSVVFLM